MLCGLPTALSVIVAYAVSGPTSEGVKVTVMTHFLAGARDALQVLVWVKSAAFVPVIEILLTVKVAFPLFTSDIGCVTGVSKILWEKFQRWRLKDKYKPWQPAYPIPEEVPGEPSGPVFWHALVMGLIVLLFSARVGPQCGLGRTERIIGPPSMTA